MKVMEIFNLVKLRLLDLRIKWEMIDWKAKKKRVLKRRKKRAKFGKFVGAPSIHTTCHLQVATCHSLIFIN